MATVKRIVPDRLSAFAGRLVRALDNKDPDDPEAWVDADDAVQTRYASGGRIADGRFFISYYATNEETWSIELDERSLRMLDAELLSEVDVEISDKVPARKRRRKGDAFVLWGEGANEQCMIASADEMEGALDALRARAQGGRAAAIFASTFGDVVYVALADDVVHIGVVLDGGEDSRLSTMGNVAETEPLPAVFPFLPGPVPLTCADYVAIDPLQEALQNLVLNGTIARNVFTSHAMWGELLLTLPTVLRDRGYVVPLGTPFSSFSASELYGDAARFRPRTVRSRRLTEELLAEAIVGVLLSEHAIELVSDAVRDALVARLTPALRAIADEDEDDRAERIFDVLMDAPEVEEVFVDEAGLARQLRG